jgi:hypothetical protein
MQMIVLDETPTLRMVTLRRLVARKPLPIVVANGTAASEIFRELPDAIVVFVDERGVLCGTQRRADPGAVADAPILEPEQDVESARLAMRVHRADRVLVVDASGHLLGVVTDRDLDR